MNFKSFLTPIYFLAVSVFCRCFPVGFSKPPQPPPHPQIPVAYAEPVITTQKTFVVTSTKYLINNCRRQLQTFSQLQKQEVKLTTLQTYRDNFLLQNVNQHKDIYNDFIKSKKETGFESLTSLESHHILPRFQGGGDEMSNRILLTPEEHTLAHFLRYLQYGEQQDAVAVLFRCGYDKQARLLNHQNALTKMKEENKGRWDSKAQSERGKKGGSKGGSANTQAQFEARQAVGKTHGQNTGLGNQSAPLQKIIQQKLEWVHEKHPSQRFITNPSKSAIQIIDQLEKFVPDQIRNSASFYKILHGERTKMYGWKLVDKGIRSEAEGGQGPSERSETST